jgi:hypothetical protein
MAIEGLHTGPWWQPDGIDIGRRRALVGLSGLALAAVGVSPAAAQGPGSCVLTPEAGEGPFYLDPKLIRADITSGQTGAPLQLALQVVRAGDCATLTNARVDVWHADALGLYSGYDKQSGVGGISTKPAVGQQYLRGTQFTDQAGNVRFRTIFPSWYGGRTPHVHFKVFLGGNEVVASQIIQTPKLIAILYESNYGQRLIYLDGRRLPPQGEPQPWWYGYSVGRWEGDTLVVETNNLRGAEDGPFDGWLDVRGTPYTNQAKFIERFRRPMFGKLEIDVTIEDAKAFTRPVTVRINQRVVVDEEPIEFVCNENQQFRQRIKIG